MNTQGSNSPADPVIAPAPLLRRFDQLQGQRQARLAHRSQLHARIESLTQSIALAPAIDAALDKLSEELFGKLARLIEAQLTLALQEVLGQPIQLKVERGFARGVATMKFKMLRDGHEEDIMKGQGGSVANILSVGLRIFAMHQLDPAKHRRFLVLDEQDCWLAPDLVPRLVKIVSQAARALGFQILMISHHDLSSFAPYADRICRFIPTPTGIKVEQHDPNPTHPG